MGMSLCKFSWGAPQTTIFSAPTQFRFSRSTPDTYPFRQASCYQYRHEVNNDQLG